jgi:hypothetical protein
MMNDHMSKPVQQIRPIKDQSRLGMKKRPQIEQTPLSIFVRERLSELGVNQSEFCRLTGFDQGLLSKIQSSMITNLSLESALRLSTGLCVSPRKVLELLGRMDLHELVIKAYAIDMSDLTKLKDAEMPPPVLEICHMALRAHLEHHTLESIRRALYPLSVTSRSIDDSTPGNNFFTNSR